MPSLFRRLVGAIRPAPAKAAAAAPVASAEIKSTPAKENPYPRRMLGLGAYGDVARSRDLPVYSWTEWDSVAKVKAALSSLEAGHFLQAAQLVDAMGRDDRIAAVLGMRVNGLLGLPIDYDEDKKDRARVAKALKDKRAQMLPKQQVRKLLRSGIMLGIGLGENVWDRSESEWTPRLKWWHPQFLQWRWDTRSFWTQTMDGMVEIHPGDGQWVAYTPYGEQLGWLDSMVRALAVPWLVRQWARRDWARYSEVHGLPIKKAIVPSKASDPDKERFVDELAQLGQESVIRLPQGTEAGTKFDVELLEASAQSWEGFQALMAATSTDIAVALLGQNLTTEIAKGAGSRAAAQVHDNVRQDVIEADAVTLDECLHEQIIRPWALYNFGDDDGAPLARTHTEPHEDLSVKATAFQTLSTALQNFKAIRAPIDVGEVLTEFGIPVVDGAEMPDLTAEPDPVVDPNAPDAAAQKAAADRANAAAAANHAHLARAVANGLAAAGKAFGEAVAARAVKPSRELKLARNEKGEIVGAAEVAPTAKTAKPAPIDRERAVVAQARTAIQASSQRLLERLGHKLAAISRARPKAEHQAAEEKDDPLTAAVDEADWNGLQESVKPQLAKVAKDGARKGLDQVGADIARLLSQANAKAIDWANARAGELVTELNETTRQGVKDLVAKALEEGWSNETLAAALVDAGEFGAARAETIARTETASADVQGNLIGWKDSGVVSQKEWIVADANECDECAAMNGEKVALDGEFSDGDPPLHPNCRCDVLPVLADEPDEEN